MATARKASPTPAPKKAASGVKAAVAQPVSAAKPVVVAKAGTKAAKTVAAPAKKASKSVASAVVSPMKKSVPKVVVAAAPATKVSKVIAAPVKALEKVASKAKAVTPTKEIHSPVKNTPAAPVKAAPVAKATAKTAPAPKSAAKAAPSKASAPVVVPATLKKVAPAVKSAAPVKAAAPVKSAPVKAAAPVKSAPVKAAGPVEIDKFLESQLKLLADERSIYTHQAKTLKAEADALVFDKDNGDTQFDDEGGEGDTISFERERDLVMSAQALNAVVDIDAAVARIYDGTYGICQKCNTQIIKERLKAIPWAALCVRCKAGGLGR